MREVDDELRDIKREIIESRGLVIKTNNLTNALSADVKSIAKRQQGYERRISWNSATAYIVFVLVVFTALLAGLHVLSAWGAYTAHRATRPTDAPEGVVPAAEEKGSGEV